MYKSVPISAHPSPRQRLRHWLRSAYVKERLCLLALFANVFAVPYWIVCHPDVVAQMNAGGLRFVLMPESQPSIPRVAPSFSPAGCQWRPVHPAWFCRSASESGSPAFEGRAAQGPIQCSGRTHAQLCASPARRTLIIGPFFSGPGEWHSMGAAYDEMLEPTDRVVGFKADAVNRSGLPVPYPPIHLHHIHVMRGAGVHWYETHGDYAMDPVGGYGRKLPDGYCDSNRQPASRTVLAQVNDVRFAGNLAMSFDTKAAGARSGNAEAAGARVAADAAAGYAASAEGGRNGSFDGASNKGSAPVLEWFLRLVFDVAPPQRACRPVTKLIWWYPVTPFAAADQLTRYEVGNRPTVYWWTMSAPRGGRILPPAWVHSHRARYSGLLLLRGAHTLDSLGGLGRSCGGGGGAANTSACHELLALRQRLRDAGGDQLVCEDDELRWPSYSELPVAPDGTGGFYDRQGRMLCNGSMIERGELFTLFSFSSARWAEAVDPFPQHTMLFMYVDGGAEETELAETFPAAYGRWHVGSEAHEQEVISLPAAFAATRETGKAARHRGTGGGSSQMVIGHRISPGPSFFEQVLDGFATGLRRAVGWDA